MDLYRSKHSDKKYSNRNSSSTDRPSRSFRNSRDNVREDTTVTCADCGDQCTVPFVPKTDKPVYCNDCFKQNKPDSSSNDRPSRNDRYSRDDRPSRNDRYSRDDRGSRYSRDDRPSRNDRSLKNSRNNSRSSRGRSDKVLKKQESFYSGGSAKFYASLQKKLYEILGEKTCSNCGSADESSLGICDENNAEVLNTSGFFEGGIKNEDFFEKCIVGP